MRKLFLIIYIFSFIFLSLSCSANKKSAIAIGDIKISADEFENAFRKSAYAGSSTKENRQMFLDVFITRKLILKEAQNRNYDKEQEFLENVQSFWEQSLLKLVLNKKMKELSGEINISEQEVMDYYQANKQNFPDKDINEVYDQIKLQIFTMKQTQALDEWVNSLKEKTNAKIDHKILGLE